MIKLFKEIGRRVPIWNQGQGGNISIKQGDRLYIKPSGSRLDDIKSFNQLVALKTDSLKQRLKSLTGTTSPSHQEAYSQILVEAKATPDSPLRPSMETGFHAFLPKTLVAHFHSLPAVAMSHRASKNSAEMNSWLEDNASGFKVSFVPLVKPGWDLLPPILPLISSDILLLENHGVIIQTDDKDDVTRWRNVEVQFCHDFGYPRLANLLTSDQTWEDIWIEWSQPTPLRVLFPDLAVFLGQLMSCIKPESDGLFTFNDETMMAEKNLAELWLAMAVLNKECPDLKTLNEAMINDISNLPTEKYRLNLGKSK